MTVMPDGEGMKPLTLVAAGAVLAAGIAGGTTTYLVSSGGSTPTSAAPATDVPTPVVATSDTQARAATPKSPRVSPRVRFKPCKADETLRTRRLRA